VNTPSRNQALVKNNLHKRPGVYHMLMCLAFSFPRAQRMQAKQENARLVSSFKSLNERYVNQKLIFGGLEVWRFGGLEVWRLEGWRLEI
jgi:hypothetical protein